MDSDYAGSYDVHPVMHFVLLYVFIPVFIVMFLVGPILQIPAWFYMRRLGVRSETPKNTRLPILNSLFRRLVFRLHSVYIGIYVIILSFIFLSVSIWFIRGLAKLAIWLTGTLFFLPFACAMGYGLYVLRDRQRALYGVAEILVGVAAILSSIVVPANSDFSRLVSLCGGLYIVVRGMDNFDQGKVKLALVLPPAVYELIRYNWERWVKFNVTFRSGPKEASPRETQALSESPAHEARHATAAPATGVPSRCGIE